MPVVAVDKQLCSVKIQSAFTTRIDGGISTCPGWYTHGVCLNGHNFVKEIYCGREWCPICGKNGSAVHNRRVARWLPKARQIKVFGYWIFTIPESKRGEFRDARKLSYIMKMMTSGDKRKGVQGILERFGYSRGLARWHFFGDKSTKWNPHLNVVVDGGYVSKERIQEIKRAWGELIGIEVTDDNAHYSFSRTVGKKMHDLFYITRPTFLDYQWDEKMAVELYQFRNTRSWGKWNDESVWILKKKGQDLQTIAELEKGLCPDCGERITWYPVQPAGKLKGMEPRLELISSGFYRLDVAARFG